jgi:hypothetical protein
MCVVPQGLVAGDIQVPADNQGSHRPNGSAQAFAEHHHIGNDTVVLEGEHVPGAPDTDWNLI